MASSHADDTTQCKTCHCSEGEKSWNLKFDETSDKSLQKCPNCQILKSGYLFVASKGIGWTSWKKRWFVLTPTSLVFYRSGPNAHAQKGAETNLSIGGIDLNNSGSVVVKADKKLLTVFFPKGHNGRTFTLKGETSEELHEWKTALENALAEAPNAAVTTMVQKDIFHEVTNPVDLSLEATVEQSLDRKPINLTVLGRPVLLALEDVDGSPSFLEKALRFIENYGVKVEGVLRQSADVEEVKRRIHKYEHGKKEFSSDEDAHVIGDCIKYVLRELPSSPVPASCCTALVEAYRAEREKRLIAIRAAIFETFPEPNLLLLQRILKMMILVAAHKVLNRMSTSALAACMAPLLLRPLLAGDCDFEDNFKMGGDGSLQLLKAAAAANHAQAIVIILLEEYDMIFGDELSQDGSLSSETCTGSEDDGVEDYELTNSDILDEDDGYHDADNGLENDLAISSCHNRRRSESSMSENGSKNDSGSMGRSRVCSIGGSHDGSILSENEEDIHVSDSPSHGNFKDVEATKTPSCTLDVNTFAQDIGKKSSLTDSSSIHETSMQTDCVLKCVNIESIVSAQNSGLKQKSDNQILPGSDANCRTKSNEPTVGMRRPTKWGRTSARKNLSMESIDFSTEDEIAIQRLENTKIDLETKFTKEVKDNSVLQASLGRRKEALWEQRLKLEKDVELLREKLQKEREFKASLESGNVCITTVTDNKAREDLEEINIAEQDLVSLEQKISELRGQLNHHVQPSCVLMCITCNQQLNKKEYMEALGSFVDNHFTHQNGTSSSHVVSSLASPKVESEDDHENHSPDHYNSLLLASKHKRNSSKDQVSTLADARPSSKLPKNTTSKSKARSNVVPSSEDSLASKRTPASKKSSSRSEDAHSLSALTRLTNRLNFLKERRAQISNELRSFDTKHTSNSEPTTVNTFR